jgi:SAM-dependent methyltransferase
MMAKGYTYEPTPAEMVLTELVGNTLLSGYYRDLVRGFDLPGTARVLDYCCGSGIIAAKIATQLRAGGRLVVAEVSERWLCRAAGRLQRFPGAACAHLTGLQGRILGGDYDAIVVHFVLHDFLAQLRPLVLQQLLQNLRGQGTLYLREPLGERHGMQLFELINLLEATKNLDYDYQVRRQALVGCFVDIRCRLKPGPSNQPSTGEAGRPASSAIASAG